MSTSTRPRLNYLCDVRAIFYRTDISIFCYIWCQSVYASPTLCIMYPTLTTIYSIAKTTDKCLVVFGLISFRFVSVITQLAANAKVACSNYIASKYHMSVIHLYTKAALAAPEIRVWATARAKKDGPNLALNVLFNYLSGWWNRMLCQPYDVLYIG